MNIRKLALIALAVVAAGFLLIQLVPYGRAHENPPVVAEPNWDSPQTRELAQRACFDCHSNETTWPWYSSIAPVSWLVEHDVEEGRQHLNFSDWNQRRAENGEESEELDELGETVVNGEMPPSQFLITHPEARLTDAEKTALANGLAATAGLSPSSAGAEHESGEENN
ncbi:MAG: heme-binding domain-containing protein [Candidatus Promineofilum sp.]|nr:heme-binding domain-containing protein [Promineifilum sp.]